MRDRTAIAPPGQKFDLGMINTCAGALVLQAMCCGQDKVGGDQSAGAKSSPINIQTADSLPAPAIIAGFQPFKGCLRLNAACH